MKEAIEKSIAAICREQFSQDVEPVLSRPEEQFGDFATNVAMQLTKKLSKPPREIAEQIAERLRASADFDEVSIAGPGFINIRLKDPALFDVAAEATDLDKFLTDKVVVTEYSDPNPFKVLHAGHLYTTLVGDAISNILEVAGAKVHRTNFGGDVGLHVARAMWGIIDDLDGEFPEKLKDITEIQRPEWISQCYVKGTAAYAENDKAKNEIIDINKRVYKIHQDKDHDSAFSQIYWTCRQWSYDGFEKLYKQLRTKPFDKYYPESQTTPTGLKLVEDGLEKSVFEESDGAVVYRGEKDGLHTRVFRNSAGLPTYEAKDLGLVECKWQDYKFDQSIIITGNDIIEYMKVVLKAMSHFHPDIEKRSTHLTHGMVRMAGGQKMSSRKGNVLLASDILAAAHDAAQQDNDDIVLGAIRYSFLKSRIDGEIIYDPKESVAQEGNSGPYLQYALVRARSILNKLKAQSSKPKAVSELDKYERSLARQLSIYPEAFAAALSDYSPHHICNYLYELAQIFNRFYENSRVAGDPREQIRSQLVSQYEKVLSHGLNVLGVPQPEKM